MAETFLTAKEGERGGTETNRLLSNSSPAGSPINCGGQFTNFARTGAHLQGGLVTGELGQECTKGGCSSGIRGGWRWSRRRGALGRAGAEAGAVVQ